MEQIKEGEKKREFKYFTIEVPKLLSKFDEQINKVQYLINELPPGGDPYYRDSFYGPKMEGSVADSLRELEQNMRFCCDRVTRMKEYGYSEDVWGTTVTELDKYVPRIQAMRELVSIKVTEHHAKSK